MRELIAKAIKARKDIAIDALAITGNSSFPQLDVQSSTLVAAEEEADISKYARICFDTKTQNFFSEKHQKTSLVSA